MKSPLVSVVITTKNSKNDLPRLLSSLQSQSYPNLETIVVDNHSTDDTLTVAKRFTSKTFTRGPERSAQRNYGAKKAAGVYLLFLDSDMELSPDVIKNCVEVIAANPTIGAVVVPEQSIGKRFWEQVKAFERSFYETSLNSDIDSARFFSRQAFTQAGGYDEAVTGPEDWDLSESVRKNSGLVKISSPIYHHENIPSLRSQAKKFYYYGLKSYRTLAKQNQNAISPKTIPFLRPELYRQGSKLVAHPILSLGMTILLSCQIVAGGLGFIVGKFKRA